MQNNFHYINLSWAVVGICKNARQPLLSCIPGIDKDEAAAVEHYVIGYMAFWHIAFVDEERLVSCHDDVLRNYASWAIVGMIFGLIHVKKSLIKTYICFTYVMSNCLLSKHRGSMWLTLFLIILISWMMVFISFRP